MKYVHAIKGSAIAIVVFILAVIYIPGQGPSDQVEIILTISTFLFAILTGFYMSRLNSRYDVIRDLVGTEDALWLTIYQTSGFFGKAFQNKIADIIDQYYVIAYDYELGAYYKHNANFLGKIYDELNKVGIEKNPKAQSVFQNMNNFLCSVEEKRNKTAILSREKVTKGTWLLLIFLAAIILFSIFYLKVPELYSQITTVLLSTVLVMVLLLMRDLQNCRLGGEIAVEESGEEVMEAMGKLRYYNHYYIEEGSSKVPANIKKYRLGLHQPGESHRIKIVTVKK